MPLQRARLEHLRSALQVALELIAAELAESEAPADELVASKTAAHLLQVSTATIYRWSAAYPERVGLQRVGGKILLSRRLLVAFARQPPREK